LQNKKVEKLKLKIFRKSVLILLWSCLIFIFVKGIISIINPLDIDYEILNQKSEEENLNINLNKNAISFTENFVKEYMNYSGDIDEYKKRLKPFIVENLEIENSKIFNVSYVNSISSDEIEDNLISVDCLVCGNSLLEDNKKTSEEKYYLRSTVKIVNNNFVITDYPIFISSPKSIEVDDESLKGEDLDDENQKEQIQKVIESFLKAYYEGENTEIKYFVENFKLSEKEKPFKFSDIKDFSVTKDKDTFYVRTSYHVTDTENNFLQSMEFKLILNNKKYVITDYNNNLGGL
jgi:formylmethanofuran dehydrogenase subunit E